MQQWQGDTRLDKGATPRQGLIVTLMLRNLRHVSIHGIYVIYDAAPVTVTGNIIITSFKRNICYFDILESDEDNSWITSSIMINVIIIKNRNGDTSLEIH